MRKIFLSSIFAFGLLASVGFGMNKSMKNNANLSDLALCNVEALANGEVIIDLPCMLIYPMPLCHFFIEEGIVLYGVLYT